MLDECSLSSAHYSISQDVINYAKNDKGYLSLLSFSLSFPQRKCHRSLSFLLSIQFLFHLFYSSLSYVFVLLCYALSMMVYIFYSKCLCFLST